MGWRDVSLDWSVEQGVTGRSEAER